MKITWATIIVVLALPAGPAIADTAYDKCMSEEKALRTEAVESCSGLSYLFNPSGCFIAQKALKKFDKDKCQALAPPERTGNVPLQSITVAVPTPSVGNLHEKAGRDAPAAEPGVEQLKAENARLNAEVERLRAELEQLRKK